MSMIYCDTCDRLVDTDYEVEHLDWDHPATEREADRLAMQEWEARRRVWREGILDV